MEVRPLVADDHGMDAFLKYWVRLTADQRGANLVEYGILVLLIAVVAIAAVTWVGDENSEMWSTISSNVRP